MKLAAYPEPPAKPWGRQSTSADSWSSKIWHGLTRDTFDLWKAAVKVWESEVRAVRKSHEQAAKDALAMLAAAGFPTSAQKRVVVRGRYQYKTVDLLPALIEVLPCPPVVAQAMTAEESYLRGTEEAARKREAAESAAKHRDAAVKWLMDHGKVYGVDFNADNAVSYANGIAAEAEIARKIADGGPFKFSGQNCDDCDGWDGKSHRCNCGNRRVYWNTDNYSFDGTGWLEGEAY